MFNDLNYIFGFDDGSQQQYAHCHSEQLAA